MAQLRRSARYCARNTAAIEEEIASLVIGTRVRMINYRRYCMTDIRARSFHHECFGHPNHAEIRIMQKPKPTPHVTRLSSTRPVPDRRADDFAKKSITVSVSK